MTADIGRIVSLLKKTVDRNSLNYLKEEPYKVFRDLVDSGTTDMRTAGAILQFMVSGLLDDADGDIDYDSFVGLIQRECSFNKKMAGLVAAIFLSLFTLENKEEWKDMDLQGLKQFKKEEMTCSWKGYAEWDYGTGIVRCYYEAEITVKPTEQIVIDRELRKALESNPFMTRESIADHYRKLLKKHLDYEFEDYCTCDDYYQPAVEDFMVDRQAVRTWCKETGFEFISCEGDGDDGGYEPKLWNGGW